MASRAYYNEIDPYAAQWLRNLIAAGHIAPGDVDERSIEDVNPDDLRGYTQCHFFAGIGVWSKALRDAGWPDDRPVWTGSCPCQPFSTAGKGGGFADERHLWPAFHWLIEQHRPDVVLGEQVASKDGLSWFDLVSSDLEGSGYACGAVDLCAAGLGAPHIRQRNYWCASRGANGMANSPSRLNLRQHESPRLLHELGFPDKASDVVNAPSEQAGLPRRTRESGGSADGRIHNTASARLFSTGKGPEDQARNETWMRGPERRRAINGDSGPGASRLADSDGGDTGAEREQCGGEHRQQPTHGGPGEERRHASPTNGQWRDADWLFCRDGKWRPVEPGTFPLAHGATARVGRLRAYGNAIVPQVAAEVINAYMWAVAEAVMAEMT